LLIISVCVGGKEENHLHGHAWSKNIKGDVT
jgi:hypothetical protein